jgi:hypothetical protein
VEKGRARSRLTGIPYTLLATAESAGVYMEHGCVRFKAHDVSISTLTALTLPFLKKWSRHHQAVLGSENTKQADSRFYFQKAAISRHLFRKV